MHLSSTEEAGGAAVGAVGRPDGAKASARARADILSRHYMHVDLLLSTSPRDGGRTE